MTGSESRLSRRLGTFDAVVIGLGSMIGAGVFASIEPAARAAGSGLLIGLAAAASVAYCNATSSAELAALYPRSGGAYVYGRERLGYFWGYLAGWGFVVGKVASCAAMALTFAAYAAPGVGRPLAVGAAAGVTIVNCLGIERTAWATRATVTLVMASLATVVIAALGGGSASPARLGSATAGGPAGILQSGGLLFFAFAGYARIATLAEEVRDPARTVTRAIPIALGITLVTYGAVAASALLAVGPAALAHSTAPLEAAVQAGSLNFLLPAVQVGAAVAALGVLLSLLAGVGRTTFAMAEEGDLPRWLGRVHPRYRVPHRAILAVGIVVAVGVAVADVREAIGFSSFTVLLYYGITNASALTLSADERRWPRWLAVVGLVGCLALAFSLPFASVAGGCVVFVVGAVGWLINRARARHSDRPVSS